MRTPPDAELDRLFQLPLAEFTAARNLLAKTAGKDAGAIKALAKPPVAAWAVNQLYWKDRARYEALTAAAADMRQAHRAVLGGRAADLRGAGRGHEAALDEALRATIALMKAEGQPVTDATRQAILNTLRALPSDEAPGRLTRTLSPGGFEMLAGITPAPGRSSRSPAAGRPAATPQVREPAARRQKGGRDAKAEREAAKAREQRAATERAVREADQRARQAEFEAARALRDAARTEKRLHDAQRAVEEAERALDEAREALGTAEREAAGAARTRDTAEKRAREARTELDAARARLDAP